MKNLAIIFMISLTISACAQTNGLSGQTVKELVLTYYERAPGNIAVDPDGNQLTPKTDTVYTLYARTADTPFTWDKAVIFGKSFGLQAGKRTGKEPIHITDNNGEQFSLQPATGETLWEIHFFPSQNAVIIDQKNVSAGTVSITINGKTAILPIQKIFKTEGLPMP